MLEVQTINFNILKAANEFYLESLQRAIQYMEGNLDKKVLLKDIANEGNLSAYHFHRVFKALTGETVKHFLVRLKLERAATKLKYSKADIGSIALESGYEDHETFSRAFKKYFNTTPIEYRIALRDLVYEKQRTYQAKGLCDEFEREGRKVKKVAPCHGVVRDHELFVFSHKVWYHASPESAGFFRFTITRVITRNKLPSTTRAMVCRPCM